MSLIAYGTNVMNFYCGFFLTWKTCQAFKIGNVATRNDTLLIKWFLLYTFIQFEPLIQLFIELIPLGWLFPFLFKGYIIMPHTKWHSLIYDFFNKLEMDEQTNKFLLYLQHATKVAVIKVLGIVETYIDIIRVDELSDVEQKLNSISEKIIAKKSSIEVRKSKLRVRNSVMDSEQQQYKSKIVPKHKTQALVLDNNVFIQYILQFNSKTCELLFMDIDTDEVIHRRSLKLIDLNEDRSLRMFYQEQEENLLIIKLSKGENVASWLEPVLEVLIEKNEIQNKQ